MKGKLIKAGKLFFIAFFAFAMMFILPDQRADAAPLVVPAGAAAGGGAFAGGVTIGAGTYALAVLGAAGVVGLACDTCADAVADHAYQTWDSSTDLAKKGFEAGMTVAASSVDSMATFGTDFISWAETRIDGIANAITGANPVAPTNSSITASSGLYSTLDLKSNLEMGEMFVVNGVKTNFISLLVYDPNYYSYLPTLKYEGHSIKLSSAMAVELHPQIKSGMTVDDAIALLSTAGYSVSTISADGSIVGDIEGQYDAAVSKVREAWESMRDAGLMLPLEDAVHAVGDTLVNYNAANDTFTDDAGIVYGHDDVTTYFPKPRIATDSLTDQEVMAPGFPGVVVDTPVMTGNPALDLPRTDVNNPAYDGPATTTNVFTGDSVITGEMAIPEAAVTDPAITANPTPSWTEAPSKQITFAPLIGEGAAMANKFPFSIPWDLMRQLEVLSAAPVAPVFEISIPEYLSIGGYSIAWDMTIDLSMFNKIAAIFRWGNLILFDIGLILMIRKLMPE